VHAYLEKAVSRDKEEDAGTGEISDAATGSSAAVAMAFIVASSLQNNKNRKRSSSVCKTRGWKIQIVQCALIMRLIQSTAANTGVDFTNSTH